jgi:TetR/AcrR family transcriptional regulator, mexJK operon transcriptional repressor
VVYAPDPPRPGRPKDRAKHAAILAAAKLLFARQPFEQVTMEAVAAQAAVSKMTVYSHFRDKETLFEAIVTSVAEQMIGILSGADRRDAPLHERLVAVGCEFLGVILAPGICEMAHSLPATLRDNRPLALRFYNAGPGRVRLALAAMIAAAAERGDLAVDDPAAAADDLVSLWEGSRPAMIAFGLADPVSAEEIRQRAVRGTEVFLRAYRPTAADRLGGQSVSQP